MNYCGIDPSLSSTGIIVLNEKSEILFKKTIKSKKLRGTKRLQFIRDEIKTIFLQFDIKQVAIESYAFGVVRSRSMFNLGELGGVLRLLMEDGNIQFIDVAPPTLKKYITGIGNADKFMVIEAVKNRWQIDFGKDSDLADAYGLARLCHEMITENKALKTIISKIKKEKLKYL